jgi:predicted transcriptional regulator
MDVPLSQDLESELSRLAQLAGRDAGHFAADVLRGYVERDAEIRAAVRRGIEQADRGQLLEHDEVVQRIEQLLK